MSFVKVSIDGFGLDTPTLLYLFCECFHLVHCRSFCNDGYTFTDRLSVIRHFLGLRQILFPTGSRKEREVEWLEAVFRLFNFLFFVFFLGCWPLARLVFPADNVTSAVMALRVGVALKPELLWKCGWSDARNLRAELVKNADKNRVLGLQEGQHSEIKIWWTRTRELWACFKTLKTNDLCFLYIFWAFKMTHFALQNEPFCRTEWFILASRMGLFEE